jgi:putative transposase
MSASWSIGGVTPALATCFSLTWGHMPFGSELRDDVMKPKALAVGSLAGDARRLAETRGLPKSITVDHGPEFEGQVLDAWAYETNVQLSFIRPGKPNENAYIESFNGKFRDECLNEHRFVTMKHARDVIENWRIKYNTEREHSSLGERTPTEYAEMILDRSRKTIFLTADSKPKRD